MDKIVAVVSAAPSATDRRDDNFSDRLSSRYTVIILVASAFIVTAALYVGNPITCWAPVHFTGSHTKFATSYCWVKNTYYLPWEEQIPHQGEERKMVPYYQWIPFILLGQAILFYMPKVLWNGLNQKVGIDADNILDAANSFNKAEKAERKEMMLSVITNQMHRCLSARAGKYYANWQCNLKHIVVKLCRPCGQKFGNYISLLYLFSKLLYIVNVVGQLFLLNSVLATDYSIFGLQVLEYVLKGYDWTEAPYVTFPRVTYCDFNVRRLGNVHRYTVQCLLPINMYTEKIYMFLWFWMVVVAIITIIDFFMWLMRYILREDKIRFITKHLTFLKSEDQRKDERPAVVKFVDNYLKQDGVFLLRLIGQNTSNVAVTDITCKLWQQWKESEEKKRDDDPDVESNDSTPSSSDFKKPLMEEDNGVLSV